MSAVEDARASLQRNVALLERCARGLSVRNLLDQRAIVDSDIELLIQAAKTEQAAECLAMVRRANEQQVGHA